MATLTTVSANRNGQHHPPQLPVKKNSFLRCVWGGGAVLVLCLGVLYLGWGWWVKRQRVGWAWPPPGPPPPTHIHPHRWSAAHLYLQPHPHSHCRLHHCLFGDQYESGIKVGPVEFEVTTWPKAKVSTSCSTQLTKTPAFALWVIISWIQQCIEKSIESQSIDPFWFEHISWLKFAFNM